MKKYLRNSAVAMAMVLTVGLTTAATYKAEANKQTVDLLAAVKAELEITEFKGIYVESPLNTVETIIRLENEDGGLIDLVVGDGTYITDKDGIIKIEDLKEGDLVNGYYVLPEVMTMQYPMKVNASVLVKDSPDTIGDVYVGMFDSNNLALDGSLIIHVDDMSEIADTAGNPYDGELANQPLVVYYSMMTMSLPPQTTPVKIVVLDLDSEETDFNQIPQDYIDPATRENIPFFVNDEYVEGVKAVTNDNGDLIVPLRALSEALGYEVTWDEVSKSVRVGVATTLKVDVNEYTLGRAMPVSLEAAPELIDGNTFVPLSFFTQLLDLELRIDMGVYRFVIPSENL